MRQYGIVANCDVIDSYSDKNILLLQFKPRAVLIHKPTQKEMQPSPSLLRLTTRSVVAKDVFGIQPQNSLLAIGSRWIVCSNI